MNNLYQRNLSVLKKTHPALYTQVQSVPEVAQSPLPSCPPSQAASVLGRFDAGADFLYLTGVGDGSCLQQVAGPIVENNRGILVIEPRMEGFAALLATQDCVPLLRSRRIFWAVGDDVMAQVRACWDVSYCQAAAQPLYVASEPADPLARNLLLAVKDEVAARKARLKHLLAGLPQRLREKKPERRVWTYADLRGKAGYSLIQHVLIRTLCHELEKRGYEVEYTVLRPGEYYPPYYRILKLVAFEPSLIFLCNEAPATEIALGYEFSRSLPIPKVVWYADDPLYGEHLLDRYPLGEDELFGVADWEWRDTLVRHGARRLFFMPGAATSTRRGRPRAARRCEVVFVGQVRDQRAFFGQLSPAWQGYCEQVIQEKLAYPRKKVREVMAQFPMPGELPLDTLDEFRQKLLWEANSRFRVGVIRSLLDLDLHVYGNEDWTRLLPDPAFARCYKGILPFKQAADLSASAAVVLNIHSLQSYTCLNVRDFDVPAAGGFLLSDWLPKADEIFEPGFVTDLPLGADARPDVFFYRSVAELRRLLAYFLSHENERRASVERARAKVIAHHTYAHRARLLDTLFTSIQQSAGAADPK
ncbi:MAG: glycosyltransferase [bacterium]|jgi:hypothetical protein|nr:glycosyltransferase [bacterium]